MCSWNLFLDKFGKFVVEYSPGFAVNPLIWNSDPASDLCHFERKIPTLYPSSKTKFDSEILETRFNEFPICAKTFSKPFKPLQSSVRLFSSSVLSENLIIWGRGKSGNDHEVEFYEIKIQLFQEIEFSIMRSKLCLFMRSNLSNNIDQEVDTLIMRSKFQKALLGISISWSIC